MTIRLWRIGKTTREILRESEPLKWKELLQIALEEANEIGDLFLQMRSEEKKIFEKDPQWDIHWVIQAKEKLLASKIDVSFSAPYHLWLDIGTTVSKRFQRTGKISFSSPKPLNGLHYYPERETPSFPVEPFNPFSYNTWKEEVWFPRREIINKDGENILLKALEKNAEEKLEKMLNHYWSKIQDKRNNIRLKADQITLRLRDWVNTRFRRIALHIAKQSSIPEKIKERLQFTAMHAEYENSSAITSYGSLMVPKRGVTTIERESDGYVVYKVRFSDHPPAQKSYYAPANHWIEIKHMARPTVIQDLTDTLKRDLNSLPEEKFSFIFSALKI